MIRRPRPSSSRAVWLLFPLFAGGCAHGPRPLPLERSPAERLAFAEEAVLAARATGRFELDAEGDRSAHLTGLLELTGSSAVKVTAEGRLDGAELQVALDSTGGEPSRSLTRGPSVSGHRGGPGGRVAEAVEVSLVRVGLFKALGRLADDEMVDWADGGVREAILASEVRDSGPDHVDGEPCHRLDFAVLLDGAPAGEASVCLSDATSLPLQRRQTLRAGAAKATTTIERYKWTIKS